MKRSRTEVKPEVIKRLKEEEKEVLLEHLECCVCLQTPRDPADSDCCQNGHFVCKTCIFKWRLETSHKKDFECPTCKQIYIPTKNLFRRQYLEYHYECYLVGCAFDGCKTEDLLVNIEGGNHEHVCVHRLAISPAIDSDKKCTWNGSTAEAGKHMAAHKCVDICLGDKPEEDVDKIKFWKVIRNNKPYFLDDGDRSLKPLVLVHPKLCRGLFWVQIERSGEGVWMIYILANLTEESLMKTRADIKISTVTRKHFRGNVRVLSAVDYSKSVAKKSGSFVIFHDNQIRKNYA